MKNEIGKRIQDLRKKAGLTQAQLADDLSISFQAVSKWEQGKALPDISSLPKLSEVFNASIDYLVTGREFEKSHERKEEHWAAAFFNSLINPDKLTPCNEQKVITYANEYPVDFVKQGIVKVLAIYVKSDDPIRKKEEISKAVDKLGGFLYNESRPPIEKEIRRMIYSISSRTQERENDQIYRLRDSVKRLLRYLCSEDASDQEKIKVLKWIDETFVEPAKHVWGARVDIDNWIRWEEEEKREKEAIAALKKRAEMGFFSLENNWPTEVKNHLDEANTAIKAKDADRLKTAIYQTTSSAMRLLIATLPPNGRPLKEQSSELKLYGEDVYQWFGRDIGRDDAKYIASISKLPDHPDAISFSKFEDLLRYEDFIKRLYKKYSLLLKKAVAEQHT